MINLPSGTKIWLVAGISDMRNGFNGLAAKVQTALKDDPMSGHVFIFRGRSGSQVKLLWSTGDGLCLLTKRLERGRYGSHFTLTNKLRSLISDLKQHGQILLVVDQPATIGALPVAVARSEGILVGYLPGLAMRRIADLHAGEAKTDARDAAIIAEAARTLPHALRTLKLADEQIAELSMLCGFDDDLAAQTTQSVAS